MSASDTFVGRVLDETREEIVRADSKANLIMASSGIGVGAVLAGLIAGDVTLSREPWPVWFFTIIAAVLVAAGIVSVSAAVYPRTGTAEAGRARYFTEIASYSDRQALSQALVNEASDPERRDLDQLQALSRLVARKYELTRRSMWLLGIGFLAGGAAAMISAVT